MLITFEQWVLELYLWWQDLSIFTIIFYPVTLTLEFDFNNKLTLVLNNKYKSFILHMSISCDEIFLLVSRYLNVLVILAIFGHYQGHLCFTNKSCLTFWFLSGRASVPLDLCCDATLDFITTSTLRFFSTLKLLT